MDVGEDVESCCTRAHFFGEALVQPGFESGGEEGSLAALCVACAGTCAGFRGQPAVPVRPRAGTSPFECGCASLGGCLYEGRLGESMGSDAARQRLAQLAARASPGRKKMGARLAGYVESSKRQHAPDAIERAREALPMADLLASVAERGVDMGDADAFAEGLLRAVLRWFKESFFTWVDTLPCPVCGGKTAHAGIGGAGEAVTEEERRGGAGRVEVHACGAEGCSGRARFPRFNDPVKLLETRRGRCGEWANCFTLVASSLGYDARICYDFTDHVWTEVWLAGRWVHMDACENAFENPHLYEKGWGKRLSYVIAVSPDCGACDVTRRYVLDYAETLGRRTECTEAEVHAVCAELQASARQHLLETHREDRAEEVASRLRADAASLETAHAAPTSGPELPRQSGSLAWRAARGELGE